MGSLEWIIWLFNAKYGIGRNAVLGMYYGRVLSWNDMLNLVMKY